LISGSDDQISLNVANSGISDLIRATKKIKCTSLLILSQLCDYTTFLPSRHHICVSINKCLVKWSDVSSSSGLLSSAVSYLVGVVSPPMRAVTLDKLDKQNTRPPSSFKHAGKNSKESKKKMRALTNCFSLATFLSHYSQIQQTEYMGTEKTLGMYYPEFKFILSNPQLLSYLRLDLEKKLVNYRENMNLCVRLEKLLLHLAKKQ
jgi:hypothetical protein